MSSPSENRARLSAVLAQKRKVRHAPQPKDKVLYLSTEAVASFLDVDIIEFTESKIGDVRIGSHYLGRRWVVSDVQLDGIFVVVTTMSNLLKARQALYGLHVPDPSLVAIIKRFNGFHCSVYRYRPPGFGYREVDIQEVLSKLMIVGNPAFKKHVYEFEGRDNKIVLTKGTDYYTLPSGRLCGAPARPVSAANRNRSDLTMFWKEELKCYPAK